jgi:hypothetical protein
MLQQVYEKRTVSRIEVLCGLCVFRGRCYSRQLQELIRMYEKNMEQSLLACLEVAKEMNRKLMTKLCNWRRGSHSGLTCKDEISGIMEKMLSHYHPLLFI